MGKFGQFRSSQISSYGTALTVEMSRIRMASENAENVVFRNVCGKLSGTNMSALGEYVNRTDYTVQHGYRYANINGTAGLIEGSDYAAVEMSVSPGDKYIIEHSLFGYSGTYRLLLCNGDTVVKEIIDGAVTAQGTRHLTIPPGVNNIKSTTNETIIDILDIKCLTYTTIARKNYVDEKTVNSNNCYYLKFWVKQRSDEAQSFTVKLLNSTLSEDNTQELADFTVAVGTSSTYYELVFQPNATYDTVVLELKRTSLDYSFSNLDSTSGRIMEANITNLNKLVNVIDYLKTNYSGLEYVKKIGVQGPAALMMCINGEQIRIGRNKIYEIHNDYKINFIGFVPNNSYFLMDFEY